MIIDCHTHLEFYPDKKFGAQEIVASMKKAKIKKALVYAGEMFNCANEKLLCESSLFKGILFPIASISPLSQNRSTPEQIEEWLAGKKIYGLKFYTGYEHFYPSDKILRPYLNLLEKYNQPAIFHSGDTWNQAKDAKLKYAHPLIFDDLASDLPNLKIVIAHFGNPWAKDAAEVSYKNKNVYIDCSGLVYDSVKPQDKILLKRLFSDYLLFGGSTDKLLFGTDWNLCDQKGYVGYINRLQLTKKEKENIFYKTAQSLFNLYD
ncbi:MAG: amidohydrolase family protein [Candidatus Portnoybacteria bacterium]|nr:amidohydrolase family protein [Candidatus Portnoybacteria bacterium]MDD4982448.1 amidohydrolase family protein [Candidatus Portnoybacteria bacterium]